MSMVTKYDLETPFGKVIMLGCAAIASCGQCQFTTEATPNPYKHWNVASRARMGLQLHAIAKHADVFKEWIR